MPHDDDGERTPQQWRDLLSTGYDYPEETEEGRRGQRRRARRAYRKSERARSKAWVEQERRREPINARAALAIVVVLLAVGVLARFGPDWLTGRDDTASRVTTAPAAATPGTPSASADGADDKPSPTAPSPSPSPSASADLTAPDPVAKEFVRHYLTRNPPEDQDHTASVERAAPWATRALTINLARSDDPAWGRLVSRGGVSTVSAVTVKPAGQDLPVDTPLRVWRTVTAKVDVVGYTTYTETTTLQVEVIHDGESWRVSRILGI
ncbi:hypothetical protein [Streptomyces sp. bgisy095]|uniref:hypothetical protein n=1 Tax=unclassified Streptomyces TaxID=2593676 RepID=UPI003D75B42D